MRDCTTEFIILLLASAAATTAPVVESASAFSYTVDDSDFDIGLEHPEDRLAFTEAVRDLRRDPNNAAIWRALYLIGTEQPGTGGDTYSIEEAIAAAAVEMFHAKQAKGFTQRGKFHYLFYYYFVVPCKAIKSVWGEYLDFISHELANGFAIDRTVPQIRQARKFCDFVRRKNIARSLYVEFKNQL